MIAFVASVALLGSCLRGEEPEPIPAAGATFINAFVDADRLLYRLDGNPIQSDFNPLPYRNVGFAALFARSNRRLEIYSSHEQARLVDTTINVLDSMYYSSMVYGTHDNPRHFLTRDRIPEGTNDPTAIVAVRFFNLANTSHRVTLRIGDMDPIAAFSNRPTETAETGKAGEAFIPTTPGTYVLSVVDENGETLATRSANIEFSTGSYWSIFLTGDENDSPSTLHVGAIRQPVN